MRLPFRVRLACLTGIVIVLTGAALLTLNYALVRQSLRPSIGEVFDVVGVEEHGGGTEGTVVDADHPLNEAAPGDEQAHLAGLPGEVERVTLREVVTQSAIALGVMSLVAVGIAWVMAGRFLRPIRQLTHTARQLSGTTLHQRIAIRGPRDELTELADTFDAMLERLERAFDAQRRFVANASHELRTPVTISRTAVDVLDAKPDPTPEQVKATIDKVRLATQRSEALIDGLLLLARTEAELTDRVPLDLAEIAASVLSDLEPQRRSADVRLEVRLQPAPVSGDPLLLERLIANLVENALKYTRRSGWVAVSTTPAGDGTATLVVANTGPVVDPAEAERLAEPFRRGAGDRMDSSQSAGLGLSIVRSIATAHGGSVSIASRPQGGLEITVALPPDVADGRSAADHNIVQSR